MIPTQPPGHQSPGGCNTGDDIPAKVLPELTISHVVIRALAVCSDQIRDAKNELFNARIAYANVIHDRIIAQHKLLAYTGKLATASSQ